MNSEILFNRLFGTGNYKITIDGYFLEGFAKVGEEEVKVIGTCKGVAIDSKLALKISEKVLDTIIEDMGKRERTIIFLVDTQGHKLSRFEEFIGINGYFAHMAKCIYLASISGHKTISIVHGEAVSGCFLAFAMMADYVCALEEAKIYVMDLKAMSKITKIEYDKLEELSKKSPVFAPGVYNYLVMGGIHEIWEENSDWRLNLLNAIRKINKADERCNLGYERKGRIFAKKIIQKVQKDIERIGL